MGVLTDFDLRHLITDFGCRILVEAGMGKGPGLDEAANYDFLQIYSIEPQHKLALDAALRHSDNHKVTVIHAKIARGLREALDEIPATEAVVFWMAGHRPGADGRPLLEQQLRLIAGSRDISRDVFLIDDLCLYEDGRYDEVLNPESPHPAAEFRHVRFVDELLAATHEIQRSFRRTGYLCAYPAFVGEK